MRLNRDFDGTGRAPNQAQLDVFNFLESAWDASSVIGINGPTGCGKSFIARTLQRTIPNTVIITPTNQLVNQYCESYPELSKCIGKSHYSTTEHCDTNFALAFGGKASIFNPASFFYKVVRGKLKFQPDVIIMDESDACYSMLRRFSDRTTVINKDQVSLPLTEILKQKLDAALQNHIKRPESKRNLTLYKSAQFWYRTISDDAHLYSHHVTSEKVLKRTVYRLVIESLLVQKHIQRQFFGQAKVILMSATLMKPDIKALTGRDLGTQYKEVSSPIAPERRQVFCGNVLPFEPSHTMDFNEYTRHVRATVDSLKHLGPGIVHSTYSEQKAWGSQWADAVTHSKDDKVGAIKYFKRHGGVLLGAGMSEGVDLPGDVCRWNIIPKTRFPNLSDNLIQKRRALEDGERWYALEALRHTLQAAGRSTRNTEDWSVVVCLDPRMTRVLNKYYSFIPQWFRESVVVEKQTHFAGLQGKLK